MRLLVFASFFQKVDRIRRLAPGFVVPMPVMGSGMFRGSEEEEMLLLYGRFFNLNVVELCEAQQLPYRYHSISSIFSAVVTVDTICVMYLQPKDIMSVTIVEKGPASTVLDTVVVQEHGSVGMVLRMNPFCAIFDEKDIGQRKITYQLEFDDTH